MELLVINQSEVRALLPMRACIAVMDEALRALARGEGLNPLRPVLWLPERAGALGLMPAHLGSPGVLGVKVISVFPGNQGTRFDSHQGAVLLFEVEHGRPLALVEASEITAVRTAAVSAVATEALARRKAGDLAILGSGRQARAHLEAMAAVRELRRARVWSRDPAHARAFAEEEGKRLSLEVEPMPSARAAVEGADLICTTTAAREPVLLGDWLSSGAHINAVGSSVPFARELDTRAVVRSKLFVDRRESALNEAGDFLIPKGEASVGDAHIRGELGEVLLGAVEGRAAEDEITLFESLGLGVEDLAAAYHVYERAVELGMGTSVELGGGSHA